MDRTPLTPGSTRAAPAEELDHHPDVELARGTSRPALALGARARPNPSRTVEIGGGARDPSAVSGAWRAALGCAERSSGTLHDPFGRGPGVWSHASDTPAPSRLHLDVSVATEAAQGVVEAPVAAGAHRPDVLRRGGGQREVGCPASVEVTSSCPWPSHRSRSAAETGRLMW